ncbi:zinc ribbon domain-containing protein [Lactiplantibacillus plantarum]|nr:zinc-ribbon domain-containing protein [Lactiplantibacillus plantarum]MBO2707226.1 zinc-ribbon domain-containing protein [Lactiplantibacillus plantarum]
MQRHSSKRLAPANEQPSGGIAGSYCPNCGTLITADSDFCPNCGYKIARDATASDEKATVTSGSTRATPSTSQPWSAKKKGTWMGIGLVIVLLIAFFVWGNQHYSRAATLSRTVSDIKSGRHLTRDFTSDRASLKLTDQKLVPINRYYRAHPGVLSQLQTDLNVNGRSSDGNFSFVQRGNHLLFFPNYQVVVTPVTPTVTTNHTGNVIKLDGKTVATANSDSFSQTLPAMVPGEYHLQASGKIKGHQLTNSSDYHITSNQTYDLQLTTITADLKTVPGSSIYLNGKEIGKANSAGVYSLNDEPWSSDMAVYAKYASSTGTATSNTVDLKKSDDQSTVDLDYENLITNSDAQDYFDNVFECIDEVSNGDDDETDFDSNSFTDYFVNGGDNEEYIEFMKMARGYYDDDTLSGIDTDVSIKDVKPGPNKTSLVTYQTKYTFSLSDEDYEHVQTFQYTATLQKATDDSSQSYQIVKISSGQKTDDYHTDD